MNVSLIIPCYNGEKTIQDLLAAVCEQNYPLGDIEVIISDGMSSDATREKIAEFAKAFPELKISLIDNPKRTRSAALNLAIQAAEGEYLMRMDVHSFPHPNYIKYCLRALEAGLGDNVGGVIQVTAADQEWIAQSIAVAAAHPLGVGDAKYRTGSEAREVDTVAFGAYHKSLIDRIGGYDETLLINEDYEFNVRVRKSGGKIWLDPKIKAKYVARSSLGALANQYWSYGYWKLRMLVRYPDTIRWRQLAGLFVLSWLSLGLLSIWFNLARWLLLIEAVIYGSALLIAGFMAAVSEKKPYLVLGLPLAIATMHFSWGSGFLWSLLTVYFDKIDKE
ncbi:MAG: glycosyltransferase family 2 protein [Chloroflexi bacterium]|nr:glycosyltransferase family 2 protein [Chloroflexota bacterium]